MMKGEIIGGDELRAKVAVYAPNLVSRFTRMMNRLVITLQRNVKADKLSGQVLNVRTGRLRRSINTRMEGENTPSVAGYVGTNVVYGRAQEYGFHGVVTVRESLRKQTKAFGKSIEPVDVVVRSHTRHVNLPEHSFLRSALADMAPTIKLELDNVARGALK